MADHLPPRAAGMPRSWSPSAMARNDSQPAACSSLMVSARSEARSCARATRTARPATLALTVNLAPRSPPSLLPRLLAAASAAFVRLFPAHQFRCQVRVSQMGLGYLGGTFLFLE